MLAMFTVLTGLGLPESPRWHDGRLWVADWTAGRVCAIDVSEQGRAQIQVVVEHDSLPMCFDFLPHLPAGNLVLTSSPQRALLRLSEDGTLTRYADLSALSPMPAMRGMTL